MHGTKHLRIVGESRESEEGSNGLQHLSDEELMLRCMNHNEQAFAELMARYEISIRRFCTGMVGDSALAADLAQDAFLKVWQHRARYQTKNKFRAYLFTISRNACLNVLRRRSVLAMVGIEYLENQSSDPSVQDNPDMIHAEMGEVMRVALAKLPEKQRSALLLRFVEDMHYYEIAQVIGRSMSTVRSRVHHGLKNLSAHLPGEYRS
jgi:RNA polymerase sigma-70 factor, ECF subfamily